MGLVEDEKFNSAALLFEAWVFSLAMAFFDVSTIVPVFVSKISASPFVIGLIFAVQSVCVYLPQLLAAKYLSTRRLKKNFLFFNFFLGKLPLGVFSLALIFFGLESPVFTLVLFFFALATFYMSEGMGGISWLDIVGKVMSSNRRGRFFGLAQVGGGTLAIAGGVVVNYIQNSPNFLFPRNYTLLFTLSFLLIMVSVISIAFIREQPGTADARGEGLIDYLKRLPKMFRENVSFARLAVIQFLVNCIGLATPFYALYAISNLSMGDKALGLLILAQTIGRTLSGLFIFYAADKWSKKVMVEIGVALKLAVPVLILVEWLFSTYSFPLNSLVAYILIFALHGASVSVFQTATSNILLEILKPVERPTGIGLMNTLNSISTIMPILGGTIAGYIPIELVFLIVIIPVSTSIIFTRKLYYND